MTLSSQNLPDDDRPSQGGKAGKPKIDRDIRNHPQYKMPWWRKPMGPLTYWIVAIVAAVIVVVAIVLSLSLGIRLF
ncbi:hypothetical protein KPL76_09910 [Subtercola sp. PAMC28395]|uniref:hypothetical protein n=1 Tax=Subtercola sp. PAMC28395 TaxID=2846775 RepID=UPI001C0CB94D|nr:hypothetical protein [Subtercola sp. PAMC28395]QWT23077.1 hypothetical protein KPL76_09910 [Subtercola sp. PAMC28395]